MLTVFFASACALNQPSPVSSGVSVSAITVSQAQKDSRLQIEKGQQTVTDEKLLVRWGGTISRIENQPEQQTLLEIVSRPLASNGRPLHNDRSDGRFVARVSQFLDPEIVTVGRDITILGELGWTKAGKIGETDYLFPVVQVSDFRYWKKQLAVQPTHFPHWTIHPHLHDDPFGHLRSRR